MEDFLIIQWSFSLVIGSLFSILFDFLQLNISKYGSEFLAVIRQDALQVITAFSDGFEEIRWHVLTNLALVAAYSFLGVLVGQHGLVVMLLTGMVIGILDVRLYIKMFAGLETGESFSKPLITLTMLQKVLTPVAMWIAYWWIR